MPCKRTVTRRELLRLGTCLAGFMLMGCKRATRGFEHRTFFNFNTVCSMGGEMSQEVLDEAQRLCERAEELFSRTIPTSDVGRINRANGQFVEVDSQTAELVSLSLAYCASSNGLFDITIGAVSELWDFSEGVVPAPEAIAQALPHVDWQGVRVQQNTVRLEDPYARLDLGGIAKGYVTDRVMDLFKDRGVVNAYVNLGGNVAVMGHNQKGDMWSVGVRDPFGASNSDVVARLKTTKGSLVTSGLYERSFEKDGQRYWHILDPRTGYPAQTDLVSASIFCSESIDGEGYTKPLFMLDCDAALASVENVGLQALLVSSDGAIYTTQNSVFELV